MTSTVALSFDDGPSEWTPALLDVLVSHDARATFFVLGCNIEGHEPTIKRMVREGHEIGIHGWDHCRMSQFSRFDLRRRIIVTQATLKAAGAPACTLWRPPWNEVTTSLLLLFDELGLEYAPVDIDGRDASREEHQIVKTVLRELREGAIVGLHDGIASNGEQQVRSREATVRAADRILGHCRSVTVSAIREKVAA